MTSPAVIPEIFYRESKFLLSLVLNTVDPGLKIAGVTDLRKRKRVEGEGKAQEREHSLLLFRPLVEPFRNYPPFFVIPEIFYRESKVLLLLLSFHWES